MSMREANLQNTFFRASTSGMEGVPTMKSFAQTGVSEAAIGACFGRETLVYGQSENV